jgi:hypothetical protein
MVLCRAAVNHCLNAKKAKHPALVPLAVKQESTRPVAPAKTEREPKLINIKIDCPI